MAKRRYSPSMYRSVKRRRVTRRSYRRRRSSYINSTQGRAVTSLYRTRRVPYRAYKRKLYNALTFEKKHRSVFSAGATISDIISDVDKKRWFRYQLPDNFYVAAGGYLGLSTFFPGKFIIKGGLISVTLRNDMTDTMIVEWGQVRYANSEGEDDINGQETESTWDISNFDNFGTGLKMLGRMRRIVVEPNGQIEMRVRIPLTVINNVNQWGTEGYAKSAIVYSIFPNKAGALNVPRVLGHNLTFCADVIN